MPPTVTRDSDPGRSLASRLRLRGGRTLGPAWGFTAALLVVVLGLILLVDRLHDEVNVERQAQLVAGGLVSDAEELRLAEDAFRTGLDVERGVAEMEEDLAALYDGTALLRDMSDAPVVSRVDRAAQEVEAALTDQLDAARSGRLTEAGEIGDARAQPALDALDAEVVAMNEHYEGVATQASRVSHIGLWVAVAIAGVAIGGLSWRHERLRRASQRQMEQRLRERVAEVAEITERHRELEAMKYSFVTAVSHELRTPLTAIHGSLEMLEDGDLGPLGSPVSRVVSVAARGTRRLARLVEDIIDLERLESGVFGFKPAPHALRPLLVDGVESLAPLADDADVAVVLGAGDATVLCDADRVVQAMVNLVGNAIKFTPAGGKIHLDVHPGPDEVEVVVRDEGRGIPAEQLGAVFDRFHQVDSTADQAKGGTGLGLTITRHVIEGQGGRIWVESEEGSGAAFHFTLPVATG